MTNTPEEFQKIIYSYYRDHGRSFLWRETDDPYEILVSEFMLQQTQTDRVLKKYRPFLEAFSDFETLARAQFKDIYSLWQGLGYNRRARHLHKTAQQITTQYDGTLPADPEQLQDLPGVGPATAGALQAFVFNKPVVFIETNIRTVFLHFYFPEDRNVTDNDLRQHIAETLDQDTPRRWYYALMDYGVMLKQKHPNPNRRSAHYAKQSRFKGSDRQIRGKILKQLLKDSTSSSDLADRLSEKTARIDEILKALTIEGLIVKDNDRFSLS